MPIVVAGMFVWIYRDSIEAFFGEGSVLVMESCVMGSIGALLSVIWRTGKLEIDSSNDKSKHYLEAGIHIIAGAISGLIVGLAVKYQLFLSAFAGEDRLSGIMMIAALASGTSERFVTSIFSTLQAKDKPTAETP
jgi:hypothetical protein